MADRALFVKPLLAHDPQANAKSAEPDRARCRHSHGVGASPDQLAARVTSVPEDRHRTGGAYARGNSSQDDASRRLDRDADARVARECELDPACARRDAQKAERVVEPEGAIVGRRAPEVIRRCHVPVVDAFGRRCTGCICAASSSRAVPSGAISFALTVAGRTSLYERVSRSPEPSAFGESVGAGAGVNTPVYAMTSASATARSPPGSDGRLSTFPSNATVVEPPESSAK